MFRLIFIVFFLLNSKVYSQFKTERIDLDEVIINTKIKYVDLYVHKIEIDSIAKVGQRIIPKIAIGNKGNIAANRKKWSWFLYINNTLVNFNRIYPINLESGMVIHSIPLYNKKYGSYIFKEKGVYNYKLIIKIKKGLKEKNEKNNIREGTIIVDN